MTTIYSNLLGATLSFETLSNYIYFYGGIFSQWADCEFFSTYLERKVNCAEQAMMLAKAKHFKDDGIYQAILAEENPREQKALGRMVRGYNDEEWSKVRLDIVTSISYDKFNQNKGWKELLILTNGFTLVEASPTDMVWGIGFSELKAPSSDKSLWGMNLLGHALMSARSRIIQEAG